MKNIGKTEEVQKIVSIFNRPEKKYLLEMGAGKLSKIFRTTRDTIYMAKKIARSITQTQLPKILILDIETSPLMAYVWQKSVWGGNVSSEQVKSDWFILCWSAKWLFDEEIHGAVVTPEEAIAESDKSIMEELWKMLDNSDIVIAHNCDKFDVPNINTRFLINGFGPTSPYQSIDTLKVARKQFGFTHNNLDALARIFGVDSKLHTTLELWKRCIRGEQKALDGMYKYNQKDVKILEEVYLRMRPWITAHPNVSLFIDDSDARCPTCGSSNLEYTGKAYHTYVSRFDVMRCECGALSRVRKSNVPADKKNNLLVSIAR